MKGFNVSFNHLSSVIPENLRQFPDSAFYPGNSLLIFPLSPSSPVGVPNMTFSVHRPLMKAAIRISFIVVLVTPSKTTEQVLNAGVYAFGAILLKLPTGKSSGEIVSGIPGVVNKTALVRQLAEENRCFECLDRLILERPSVNNPPRVLDGMLQVTLRCIHPASERPDIKTVFQDTAKIVN
ncbi:inactive receptor kinase [Pyrus ussuriensis x Pyrus communis]|uniref:Inactive receptor kinase n=1 Tax=Pyrus ussuriensis x Pyrus communis TaxID=2448454 RepID=A0A5N5GPZ4_9ROSA|nr:inactive receptor kinase [Pyrus ussuriensis x Pyrus communis]